MNNRQKNTIIGKVNILQELTKYIEEIRRYKFECSADVKYNNREIETYSKTLSYKVFDIDDSMQLFIIEEQDKCFKERRRYIDMYNNLVKRGGLVEKYIDEIDTKRCDECNGLLDEVFRYPNGFFCKGCWNHLC